ncbi:MAG: DinB family protein [Acidobacteriaceae bacterium]
MEPWLRGTHTDLPAVLRAVVHAIELAREDVDAAVAPLADAALEARPGNVASIAFHLRHIPRSLDRLLTYAEGNQLSAAQLGALQSEGEPGASKAALLAEFHAGLDAALPRVRALAAADLAQPRAVGRKALPTTVAGLLVHCADHTQRHAGQLVTTARILARPDTAS